MEISAQRESNGILYEGYTDEFKLCIFEDGVIQGRNERYEFRCDANLECCGRSCCIPADATIPLWLLLLFIILGLLLLCLLLSALAYWLSKRPRKPKIKKDYQANLNNSGGYRTIRHVDDDVNKEYSALDESAANANGYGNRGYDISAAEQGRRLRRRGSDSDEDEKFVPSPLEETLIAKPQPVQIIQHNEDEISRASVPETVEMAPLQTQKAQHAFYRPFVPDVVEEQVINPADRGQIIYHDVAQFSTPKYPSYTTLERPKERKAEHMYTRPGMDNVPSY